MRILIKGGVWKNTEDEILKAAVMKYGKNQWSRISSLLARKSAKQCKARWHEWLDPSIKKTEWSREEEEKLLHLAKLMPTQWRTIAPIVGRTAAQCLEHYERLLDQATRRDQDGETSAADDPRRLRPGEIDPNPEGKPARPDPVDMDEDEKEMLSEARARLANTRGKKAKRKAREKQLEESRRLAALQKRRELKAAGIELSSRSRKERGIDYNSEIPFQLVTPAGFFDTRGEDAAAEAVIQQDGAFKAVLKSRLDAPNRDQAEEKARKEDSKKLKRKREEALPDVLAQLNDATAIARRGKLMLPPPQVTDRELEEVVKASSTGAALPDEGAGADATRLLTHSYADAYTPASFGVSQTRTPRVGGKQGDTVLEEAAAQALLLSRSSALTGGDSGYLEALGDFSGVTPKHAPTPTPNAIASGLTPAPSGAGGRGAAGGASARGFVPGTPAGSVAGSIAGSTFSTTSSRDAFGINEGGGMVDLSGLPQSARKRLERERRAAVAAQLSMLPAPVNEYKIVMPSVETGEEGEEGEAEPMEEDAMDAVEREAAAHAAARAAELAKRSTALQRGLPRPLIVNRQLTATAGPLTSALMSGGAGCSSEPGATSWAEAEAMMTEEMVRMLEADATAFPPPGAPEGGKKRKPLKPLPPELLESAKAMLAAELEAIGGPSAEEFAAAWEAADAKLAYIPSLQTYAALDSVSAADRLEAYSQQLQLLRNHMAKDQKKATKIEKKLEVTLGGYRKRAKAAAAEMEQQHDAIAEKKLQLNCFERLAQGEALARPQRLGELEGLVTAQAEREKVLQARYAELLRVRQTLREQLQALRARAGSS
jgi:pre-mRNA-splicing factor CDC5/CEF1